MCGVWYVVCGLGRVQGIENYLNECHPSHRRTLHRPQLWPVQHQSLPQRPQHTRIITTTHIPTHALIVIDVVVGVVVTVASRTHRIRETTGACTHRLHIRLLLAPLASPAPLAPSPTLGWWLCLRKGRCDDPAEGGVDGSVFLNRPRPQGDRLECANLWSRVCVSVSRVCVSRVTRVCHVCVCHVCVTLCGRVCCVVLCVL